jgi:hypothetical protein
MESQNHKVIKGFLHPEESREILGWVDSLDVEQIITNHHIKEVRKNLNGNSYMFNVSKTPETNYIAEFQSSGNVIEKDPPPIIYSLINRISSSIGISKDRVFFQVIDMNKGGKVNPHYDSSIKGYINYKCNISVLSDDYNFYVDGHTFNVKEGDLYCFEASLYKHWSDIFESRRVLLSFGFVLPYAELGRKEDDPRVRLSRRILRYFQNL